MPAQQLAPAAMQHAANCQLSSSSAVLSSGAPPSVLRPAWWGAVGAWCSAIQGGLCQPFN